MTQITLARTTTTPCVGICSTTYGDLVCRGCKRFAHEVVAWNGYQQDQKDLIWQRLNTLRDQVVSQLLVVRSAARLNAYCEETGIQIAQNPRPTDVHRVLAHLVAQSASLDEAGLAFVDGAQCMPALDAMKQIDGEIYNRSTAHYERNFRITS